MILQALGGFVFGFILGMMLNSYLLRNVPKEKMTGDRSIRLKYGALNWLIALGFMFFMIKFGNVK